MISVTRKNRKPVPVLSPEDEEDAYDGLAYDRPVSIVGGGAGIGSPSMGGVGGGEWEGAKQMRVIGVDLPTEGR